jgi:thiosulfate/3-mercaptopyruvate sulfurtransferase
VANTLVNTTELARHIADPDWAIVDCRFALDDTSWGEHAYEAGHIPGAVYAHLDNDLSGAKTGTNGRHPLPAINVAAATFGRLGIGRDTQVVAYDQDSGMFASRLWWMLRWLGHDRVAVLDGGFAKWQAEGRDVATGREHRAPRNFVAIPQAAMLVSVDEVATLKGGTRLVDARAPERFRGEVEPLDRVPGHIPGALNHFFKTNLNEEGTFRSADELRAQLTQELGTTRSEDVVCYCGSGVTACHNVLAMEHAGLTGVRLYAGSWSEWCSDPTRPVARGDR